MIPKLFVQDHPYPHYAQLVMNQQNPGAPSIFPNPVGGHIEVPPNTNIDSLLQVHRRKMLRRAANRRSAQLSRARKKAHLEELKIENSRLQRLVDVLDSQPELVFCITVAGKITYISERMINFIKINPTTPEDGDEDPTHISQILAKESVSDVLKLINKLARTSNRLESEANLLFAAKEVFFQDAFGHPVAGSLRCTRVQRRTTLQEMQSVEGVEQQTAAPPAKKPRTKSNASVSSNSRSQQQEQLHASLPINGADFSRDLESWNLSNFKLLTDCVSSLATSDGVGYSNGMNNGHNMPLVASNGKNSRAAIQMPGEVEAALDVKRRAEGNSTSSDGATTGVNSNESESINTNWSNSNPPDNDKDEEFVCIIRTSEKCFASHRADRGLLMFSSKLSTASMNAHDSEYKNIRVGRASPNCSSESNNSLNSSSNPQGSDGSSSANVDGNKNSTSSETASDDNNSHDST